MLNQAMTSTSTLIYSSLEFGEKVLCSVFDLQLGHFFSLQLINSVNFRNLLVSSFHIYILNQDLKMTENSTQPNLQIFMQRNNLEAFFQTC